ncbi:exo-alpha-sialidase [candidate division KSB1 bacterium]|nr:exo-alpha-sialidase [candidate division KSB1 bacterium]
MVKIKPVRWCVAALAGILLACSSTPEIYTNLPELAQPGTGAYLVGELIYPLENKPTPECHASTIEETSDGFIAAWFGGKHESNPDVSIWISKYDGETWSEPVEVATGIQNANLRYPCWNPVLFQPGEGTLMLFYKVGPSPRKWWGMLITSTDEGETWSEPVKLGEDKKLGYLLGPVKNKPIQLADGTILCASSTEEEAIAGSDWCVHFEFTRDLGKTWRVISPINDGSEFDAIQPSILTYPSGKLQILCRTRQNVISQSWSEDNGETWSKMTATALPNPSAGIDAVTLKDGRQLLIYNHTTRKGDFPKSRNMLNLALSSDGITWKPVMTLERQQGEYSYPAIIQGSDGLVHITYTYRRESIKYVVVDPAKLN